MQIYYDGNTYTPNDKKNEGRRVFKCGQYYKKSCKARLTINAHDRQSVLKISADHSHPKMYTTEEKINQLFNYK